ncbi:acetate/propionate family kinase [Novilysobacter defluvii]|uniref:acetate/propionate family kinase n=1 Tax=Novilysobacter defluvii TaxID=391738 RepID=UPI000412C540|nr:acetate/propionate family kinase [Lysobacter defluvii]
MTTRRLLALNVGSSTLKGASYLLNAERTGAQLRVVEQSRAEIAVGVDAQERLAVLVEALSEPTGGLDAVVHRFVHGGDLRDARELDDGILSRLEALVPFAPVHQPAALAFARAARMHWPHARQGVAFDTAFHASLAPWSRRLPIPEAWDALGVRRYGFHGLAFASALRIVASHDARILQGRAVFAHLGGGCSVCAVEDGRSRDTTMALTPIGGIPSPTRSGDIDPGALLYLLRHERLDAQTLEDQLSRAAGLAGIAGHSDMRVLLADPDPQAQLAVELFAIRVAQSIAAMATGIGGLDHVVFSGGIGHRAPGLRARIVAHLGWLGLKLAAGDNDAGAARIDSGSGPAIWNVAIDEERELAESALAWL